MIRLFRHDGLELLINVDWIDRVEADPKTVIILRGGERIEVKNTVTDVVTKIKAYRQGMEDENRDFDEASRNKERGTKTSVP